MEMIFCPNCQKVTGYKRALGFGTLLGFVLTGGLWLLAVPFYPRRCITCGTSDPQLLFGLKGSAGLIIAVAVVAILLIALPAYRWFFLISVLIGLVIAGGLTLWYRLHPIRDVEVENKRPLGLD